MGLKYSLFPWIINAPLGRPSSFFVASLPPMQRKPSLEMNQRNFIYHFFCGASTYFFCSCFFSSSKNIFFFVSSIVFSMPSTFLFAFFNFWPYKTGIVTILSRVLFLITKRNPAFPLLFGNSG